MMEVLWSMVALPGAFALAVVLSWSIAAGFSSTRTGKRSPFSVVRTSPKTRRICECE